MKRQSILFILLLLLNLLICCGCSGGTSADTAKPDPPPPPEAREEVLETAKEPRDLPDEKPINESGTTDIPAHDKTENVKGIFEGLEGNHTAVFSFDGVETAFHFEEPSVQDVLFEAVAGSSYTLSYYFDPSTGLYIIYEISES